MTVASLIDLAVAPPRTRRDHDNPPESNRLEPRVLVCHPLPQSDTRLSQAARGLRRATAGAASRARQPVAGTASAGRAHLARRPA